jgi:16S rRNA processing protein RimM
MSPQVDNQTTSQSSQPTKADQFSKDRSAFLVVGRIRRSHGIRGEVVMEVISDFPERIRKGTHLFLGETYQPVTVELRRNHQEGLLIRFEQFVDPESVEPFRNQWVYVDINDRPPLPKGEYYHHQILGLDVFDEEDKKIGKVIEVLETGANDVLVIRQESNGELLIPVIPQVIQEINLDQKILRICILPGLLPEKTGRK